MANKTISFLGYIAVLSLLFPQLTLCDPAQEPAPDPARCSTVISNTTPSPSDSCCSGVKNVAAMANNHENKVHVCDCLKTSLAVFKYDPALVAELPQKCSVNLSLPPISEDTDCSK
ncbi:putative non-specific lipid-transfer protein 2 [Bienertia sinuspersici]